MLHMKCKCELIVKLQKLPSYLILMTITHQQMHYQSMLIMARWAKLPIIYLALEVFQHASAQTFEYHLFPSSQYCYNSPVLIGHPTGSRLSWPEHVGTTMKIIRTTNTEQQVMLVNTLNVALEISTRNEHTVAVLQTVQTALLIRDDRFYQI